MPFSPCLFVNSYCRETFSIDGKRFCDDSITPCTALAIGDECGRTARLHVIKVRSHHAAPTPITLAESTMADRLQAGRSGLQMSSWPGTVIPR